MNCIRRLVLMSICVFVMASNGYGTGLPNDTTRFGNRSFGFHVGAAYSHLTSGDTWNNRYGLDFGVATIMNLTDIMALQGELAYISKGTKWDELLYRDGNVLQTAGSFSIGYVQLAVLARVNQPLSRYRDENVFRPKLLAGLGWNTKVHSSADGIEAAGFPSTDFSFIFGGGFDHRVGPRRFVTLDVRFDLGLRAVYLNCNNNTVRFLLGLTL